jgi:hypothetical protein
MISLLVSSLNWKQFLTVVLHVGSAGLIQFSTCLIVFR